MNNLLSWGRGVDGWQILVTKPGQEQQGTTSKEFDVLYTSKTSDGAVAGSATWHSIPAQ